MITILSLLVIGVLIYFSLVLTHKVSQAGTDEKRMLLMELSDLTRKSIETDLPRITEAESTLTLVTFSQRERVEELMEQIGKSFDVFFQKEDKPTFGLDLSVFAEFIMVRFALNENRERLDKLTTLRARRIAQLAEFLPFIENKYSLHIPVIKGLIDTMKEAPQALVGSTIEDYEFEVVHPSQVDGQSKEVLAILVNVVATLERLCTPEFIKNTSSHITNGKELFWRVFERNYTLRHLHANLLNPKTTEEDS